MRKLENIVGPQIKKLRKQQGLTQEMLAAKCSARGWDISPSTLSKIEVRLRFVTDVEIFFLCKLFKVQMEELFPNRVSIHPSHGLKSDHLKPKV